jgi:hypothetical protein
VLLFCRFTSSVWLGGCRDFTRAVAFDADGVTSARQNLFNEKMSTWSHVEPSGGISRRKCRMMHDVEDDVCVRAKETYPQGCYFSVLSTDYGAETQSWLSPHHVGGSREESSQL